MDKKFEKLVDMVITESASKEEMDALFHDIVVEQSRKIYESLMDDSGDMDDLMFDVDADEEGLEYDLEEGLDDIDGDGDIDLGDHDEVDPTDDMVDLDADETHFDDSDVDGEHEADLEDRVVDLESQIEELTAEFERLMAEDGDVEGGDDTELGDESDADLDMDGEDVQDPDLGDEDDLKESVSLVKVPAPKMGDNGANSKSPVAANAGQKGMPTRPVRASTSVETGRAAPKVAPISTKFRNEAGISAAKLDAVKKPAVAKDTGNVKSVMESRKRK